MTKRIDLTQFEGITEGYADGAWELNNPQDTNCLVPLVGTIVAFSEANANAVVQLPKLIAELKRCYEEIDALQGIIDDAHEAMEKYSNEEIDNVCDAYEEVCMALY